MADGDIEAERDGAPQEPAAEEPGRRDAAASGGDGGGGKRPRSTGWTRPRIVFLAVAGGGAALFAVLAAGVLLPFVLALLIAYILSPLVAACERRLRLPRVLAILAVYAVALGLIYGGLAAALPRLLREVGGIARETPGELRALATEWEPVIEEKVAGFAQLFAPMGPPRPSVGAAVEATPLPGGGFALKIGDGVDVVEQGAGHWHIAPVRTERSFHVADLLARSAEESAAYLQQNVFGVLKMGHAIVRGVARGLFLTAMTLMVAGYLLHTREGIVKFLLALPPPSARESSARLLARMDKAVAGVVRGQLTICLVNGVLSAIGFWLFGVKYWPLLAVVAGVLSIVPIFGSILSTVPAVALALGQGVWAAAGVLIWILAIHQLEAHFLNPKIIGHAAKLHPVLVVLVLLVGEHFFGLKGAVLAVPALALVQAVFLHWQEEASAARPAEPATPAAPAS